MVVRAWNLIELCAGAGGLGLGIELACPGAVGVAYVEREAAAAAKLVHRMETGDLAPAPVWSDLGNFDARAWRGRVLPEPEFRTNGRSRQAPRPRNNSQNRGKDKPNTIPCLSGRLKVPQYSFQAF